MSSFSRRPRSAVGFFVMAGCCLWLLVPDMAQATQGHAGVEGVHVHQFAHIFFAFSMGTFIYWLRRRKLVRNSGWRFLQYAAFLFILWNMDAFTVHFLEEQLRAVAISRVSPTRIDIVVASGFEWLVPVYYAAKLDHLLCVPAMLYLYLGLQNLLAGVVKDGENRGAP